MGLLQDPSAALDQAQWYLENRDKEKFPGAFELAAGNLCRQTVEQILFILCFYSSMPKNKYMKTSRQLKTPWNLYEELKKTKPDSNKKYIELARIRGPRIRKFATKPRTLNKWRKTLNESAHFSIKNRCLDGSALHEFIAFGRQLFDNKDRYLIVAAINDIFSSGRFRAVLSGDEDNTPGILIRSLVSINNIKRTDSGGITLIGPDQNFHVISSTEIPRGPWPIVPVMIQNAGGMAIIMQFVKKDGAAINIANTENLLNCFATTAEEARRLKRHLSKLGFNVHRE